MKKEYAKPVLLAESFELCEHVSRSCGLEGGWATHWDSVGVSPCGIRQFGPGYDEDILFGSKEPCTIDTSLFEPGTELIDYHGTVIDSVEALFSS